LAGDCPSITTLPEIPMDGATKERVMMKGRTLFPESHPFLSWSPREIIVLLCHYLLLSPLQAPLLLLSPQLLMFCPSPDFIEDLLWGEQ